MAKAQTGLQLGFSDSRPFAFYNTFRVHHLSSEGYICLMLRTPVLVGLRATPLAPRALRVATLELSHLQLYSRRPFSSHSKLCAEEQQKHTFQPHPAGTFVSRHPPPSNANSDLSRCRYDPTRSSTHRTCLFPPLIRRI